MQDNAEVLGELRKGQAQLMEDRAKMIELISSNRILLEKQSELITTSNRKRLDKQSEIQASTNESLVAIATAINNLAAKN